MAWEIKCDNILKHLLGSCAVFSDLPYICIVGRGKGGLGHKTYINPHKLMRDYWVYVIVKLTIMIQGHYIVKVTTVAFPCFPLCTCLAHWPTLWVRVENRVYSCLMMPPCQGFDPRMVAVQQPCSNDLTIYSHHSILYYCIWVVINLPVPLQDSMKCHYALSLSQGKALLNDHQTGSW